MGRIAVRGELSLDGSGWDKTLRRAEGQVNKFGGEALGYLKGQIAAAFSAGAIIAFGKSVVDAAEKIKQASEQFGITTDEAQNLGRAAEHIGLTLDEVGAALGKFGKARKEAAEGNVALQHTLERLGISYRDLQDPEKRNLDLLRQMATAMKGMEFNAAQREELRELFGRSGDRLAALFGELQTMKPIQIITPEQVDQIHKAKEDLEDMWKIIQAMAAGPISDFSKGITAPSFAERFKAVVDAYSSALPGSALGLIGKGYRAVGDTMMQSVNEAHPTGMGYMKSKELYGPTDTKEEPAAPLFPGFFKYDIAKNNQKIMEEFKSPKSKALEANSLVRVGNFLGDSPRLVQIAETELTLAQKNNIALTNIERNTSGMSVNQSGLGFSQ